MKSFDSKKVEAFDPFHNVCILQNLN